VTSDAAAVTVAAALIAADLAAVGCLRAWQRRRPRRRREYPPLNPHVPMPPAMPEARPGRGDPVAVVELYACPCVVHRDSGGPRLTPCSHEHDEALWEGMERRVGERWGPLDWRRWGPLDWRRP
jgi:hypothetical protein